MASRRFVSFPFTNPDIDKEKVLNWLSRFDIFCYLDNQHYPSAEDGFEALVAAGARNRIISSSGHAFTDLKNFSDHEEDWLFGHFSFDLKSETENCPSHLPDPIGFPELFFFVPEIILLVYEDHMEIGLHGDTHLEIAEEIATVKPQGQRSSGKAAGIRPRISKTTYLSQLSALQEHIHRGDCYEINFCQEFFADATGIDPLVLYKSMQKVSPNPFSAFYRIADRYLLCASPERFLKKTEDRIISQPIKGTAPRDPADPLHDRSLREALAASSKDQAENVMVVDLVRNDLSKICVTNSVKVDELFGIYSFPQVHQMISTISGKPSPEMDWTDMIRHTFPMGSMTGAPKKSVLELIEKYEKTRRGLFSGALGYVKPNRDFDFNVVIRSILINQADKRLSFFAGSGITAGSDPEKEYEECLIKVAALERIIKNPSADGPLHHNLF